MEIQGKVIAALPERSGVSQRGEWKIQEFVIETLDAAYPRKMMFSVFGADRLQRFNIQVGQVVNVAFDIDAREWNGRWFNDIRAFDVRQVDPSQPVGAPQQPMTQPSAAAPVAAPQQVSPVADAPMGAVSNDTEDLPF